nr:putative ribonuclease H-like domain-containing protein [Tanacetum cinerariifolium]
MCYACAMGKSKKKPHKLKSKDTNQEKLYLLHMDFCGPMRVSSVNEKKYIRVIVDDYSRFTWVKCLRSKDKAPDFIIKFLKMIQVRLKVPVRRIKLDNGTEFVNQTLREYYEKASFTEHLEGCSAMSFFNFMLNLAFLGDWTIKATTSEEDFILRLFDDHVVDKQIVRESSIAL